jgi:D-arabinose 1-dehydrogenase-like Zn-dependent alcohol dehydrogenase
MLNDWNLPKMSDLGVKCAGHEGSGVIVKVGENVKGLRVGQRAGFKPIQNVCHICEHCKSGREQYCLQAVFTGGACDGEHQPPARCYTVRLINNRILQAVCHLAGQLHYRESYITISFG